MIATQKVEADTVKQERDYYKVQILLEFKKLPTPEERVAYLRENVCPHIQDLVEGHDINARCGQEKGKCSILQGFPYNEFCPLDVALSQVAYQNLKQNRKA